MAPSRNIQLRSHRCTLGAKLHYRWIPFAFGSVVVFNKHELLATGSGSCVGLAGPGLGGGHGPYQGLYGLISDNFVSLNVVLANGSAIKVNETTNADLWWAMRGTGHNFGIVTSFELDIYPAEAQTWYYKSYVFTGDQLEPLFKELNEFQNNGSTPKLMAGNFGVYTMHTNVSQTEVSCCSIISPPCISHSHLTLGRLWSPGVLYTLALNRTQSSI